MPTRAILMIKLVNLEMCWDTKFGNTLAVARSVRLKPRILGTAGEGIIPLNCCGNRALNFEISPEQGTFEEGLEVEFSS